MKTSDVCARVITEVCAPWVTNTILFACLGVATGDAFAGVLAAALTGIIPMAGILALMARQKVGSHHVTNAQQRMPVFVWIALCLMVLLFALVGLNPSREIWVAVLGACAFIAAFSAVTKAGLKISVHSGLWLVAFVFMGAAINPWWWVGLSVWPMVMWSRIRLSHHTYAEVIGGVIVSAAVSMGMVLAL